MVFAVLIATVAIHSITKAPTSDVVKGQASKTIDSTFSSEKSIVEPVNGYDKDILDGLPDNAEGYKEAISLLSVEYGLDYQQFYNTVNCESGFRHYNNYGDDGRSFGVAQFLSTTFNERCEGDYYNPFDQLKCMANLWSQRMQKLWTCWKKLYQEKTIYDECLNH